MLVEAYDRMSALQARIHNIQVQLLLTSGPFLASQHQDNSILHIFLTSPSYTLFFYEIIVQRLVPEGTKAINLPSSRQTRRPLVSSDLLRCGNDWVFLFDLETGLIFPPEIASTTQRPDIVIYSKSKNIVVLIELTCPLENRISTAHDPPK